MKKSSFRALGYACLLSAVASIAAVAQETIPVPNIAMYVWTDKYVYQPGERATLRWTVKTNDDATEYTMVAYRQNNQTGKRFFLPGLTEEVTDITGKKVGEFAPAPLQNATKAVVAGDGGLIGALTIPNELGMHTIVVQLRDASGLRVLKSAYMKIGVVDEFVTLSGNIEETRVLVNTKAYRLSGTVFVRNNAILIIDPGTFIIGQPGSQPPSALIVTRNAQIYAAGTKARPIIMTSSRPFGERTRGDWGGLVLLGRAPINVASGADPNRPNADGEFSIEGLPATEDTRYGGSNPDHNCGTLKYVRVEYAGAILSPNNELNSFTWGGCGKATVSEYLQAHYGLDDSFEWFGGTSDAKYLVGGLGADDFVDYQLGYTGRIQFGVFYQSADSNGNRGIEGDNSEYNNSATPRSRPQMYNLTFIGSGVPGFDEGDSPGIFLRRGAGGELNNMLVTRFYSSGVRANDATTQAQVDAGTVTMNGVLLWNNGLGTSAANTVAGQVHTDLGTFAAGTRGSGLNFFALDPMLRRPFEYSDPDFRPMTGSPVFRANWIQPPDDGFFQNAGFIGGMGDSNWMEEWTNFLVDSDIKVP
ncbi:hypothetical protein F183_A47420 [Bryobacterales bacterium F-183]|nr:hypothetical protein F183_A47420 [Bryobacterales bacterium F-183]